MKHLYLLHIYPSLCLEDAWNALETAGIEILYGSEEEEQIELYVHLSSPKDLPSFAWIKDYSLYTLPTIDWEAQWANHGHNFHDGYVHVDLSTYDRKAPLLRLKPGAGFGDLSHPTTRLMLRLLAKYVNHHIVIDIGCGSGILTLAAIALGARSAYGIDIDPAAIEHSYDNACLNELNEKCTFSLPDQLQWKETSQPVLILMNMIQSEQEVAWSSLSNLHHQPSECITSGIRSEGRQDYLTLTKKWGWTLLDEQEEDGWLAFQFISNLSQKMQNKIF